ncbi:BRO family protein [Mycobacterium kansasii]
MSAIELFTYTDHQVRVVIIDGEPWFILADLCRVLEIASPGNVAARLADDQKGIHLTETPGGRQQMVIVSEPGMYEVVIRSDKPEAVTFRRWITGTVLPEIRKTGSYSTAPALTDDELIHRALEVSARRVAELTERVAELEPQAQVATKLLDAEGDLSVRDAAQSLTRAGIKTGERRLFSVLDTHMRWIRRAGDGRYRVLQSAIDSGYMSVLPQSHFHPRTGVLVLDPPQPRVTPKGLQRLLSEFDRSGS